MIDLYGELMNKGLVIDEKSPDYKNLTSAILVRCEKGHLIQTNLLNIRRENFACPICEGLKTKGFDQAPTKVPQKEGYRIVGLDNATHNLGISIFDDGKLVYYKLHNFTGTSVERLNAFRDLLEDVIIKEWKPDFLQFENIQFQRSYPTFELLSKLLGACEMAAERYNVEYDKVKPSVWRSKMNINGAKREEQKKRAIDLVYEMYQIKVNDDIAEAILIAKYRVDIRGIKELKDLF